MEETSEKIVEYIANKLEKIEQKMELQGRTMSKIIEDMRDINLKTLNLHKRLEKIEQK